jgi:hypothetical protein
MTMEMRVAASTGRGAAKVAAAVRRASCVRFAGNPVEPKPDFHVVMGQLGGATQAMGVPSESLRRNRAPKAQGRHGLLTQGIDHGAVMEQRIGRAPARRVDRRQHAALRAHADHRARRHAASDECAATR